jgi:UDP-N-acetylmuramoylalanine--D-glutamate ligase
MRNSRQYYLVVGLGKSGISMAKFLKLRGFSVVATDIDASKAHLAEELKGICTELGFHNQESFDNAFKIIPSPGIPLSHPNIKAAMEKGVEITGELDIFSAENTMPVIAITGTNGKTTTTTLIGDILKACGRKPFVGGNIGTPLPENLMNPGDTDVVVAEISSFQLDIAEKFKPNVGVLLNISQDHMDRYDSYADYEASKWNIFKNQSSEDTAIINRNIKGFEKHSPNVKSGILDFSSEPDNKNLCKAGISEKELCFNIGEKLFAIQTENFKELHGVHNRENIAAAVLACMALGETGISNIIKGIETFKNLSHRMEYVTTIKGVSFYNDSKATNPDAVIRALESFKENIILILGGREKETDFSLLFPQVTKRVKSIIAIGESKDRIIEMFGYICPVVEAENMKDAVNKALAAGGSGDIVLLSPACASFDMFKDYAHRGDSFKKAVKKLEDKAYEMAGNKTTTS